MLPINLLQSQLAHNKKRINELHSAVAHEKEVVKYINRQVKDLEGDAHAQDYTFTLLSQRIDCLKELQKTRKHLKQLAILQKEIKQTIQTMCYYQANGKKLMFVTSKL